MKFMKWRKNHDEQKSISKQTNTERNKAYLEETSRGQTQHNKGSKETGDFKKVNLSSFMETWSCEEDTEEKDTLAENKGLFRHVSLLGKEEINDCGVL